jgi:hypothetical protein
MGSIESKPNSNLIISDSDYANPIAFLTWDGEYNSNET